MAGTAVERRRHALPQSAEYETPIQLNKAVTDLGTLQARLTQIQNALSYRALGNPAFAIKTNFDVQNANALSYTSGDTLKTFAAAQTFDTGTAQVIVADKWSSALLSLNSSGSPVVTWSATLNAASEALAIAALPAIPATSTVVGYITVLTGSGVTWTAGTDALASGTGGTPATTTNYYNNVNPAALAIGTVLSSTDMTAAQINENGAAISA